MAQTAVKSNNFLKFFLMALCLGMAIYYLYCWFMGENQAINWQVLSQLYQTPKALSHFVVDNISYEIPSRLMYVTEQYVPTLMQVNGWVHYLFLAAMAIGISGLWAIGSFLDKSKYYILTILLIILAISFDLDTVFGKTSIAYSAVYVVICIGLSYYFFINRNSNNFLLRFLIFLLLNLILGVIIYKKSPENQALMLLAIKCIPAALVLLVVLCVLVSFDIVHIILIASTAGQNKHGLTNFSVGSAIYLGNLFLVYLHNTNHLDWQIQYLSAFLVFLFSVIIGYFLLSKKTWLNITDLTLYEIMYSCLALISLGFLCFAFATANDALLETAEDIIIYTHLIFGILFFVYVLLNFYPVFRQQLNVAKIAYKPLFYPLYYFVLAGVLIIVSILMNNAYFPVMQAFSGYYSALGDHSKATENYPMAEAYYKNALGLEHQNHKVNYAMASLAAQQGDNTTAGTYYRLAVQKKPTVYAFAALSQSLAQEDLYFDALFALRDGLKKFPLSGELQNNMALIFEKSKALDSANFYLQKATKWADNKNIPMANILGLSLKYPNTEIFKNKPSQKVTSDYNTLQANKLATSILENKIENSQDFIPKIKADSSINLADLALWNNYVYHQNAKGNYVNFPLIDLSQMSQNVKYNYDLLQLAIQNEIAGGDRLWAINQLKYNAQADSSQAIFNTKLANTIELKLIHEQPKNLKIENVESAKKLFLSNPYNKVIIDTSIDYLNKNKAENLAYELLESSKKNMKPQAIILQKYILQCFKMNLKADAQDAFDELNSIDKVAYKNFAGLYLAQLQAYEKAHAF